MNSEQKPTSFVEQSPLHEALHDPPSPGIWGLWKRRWNGECIALLVSFASTATLVVVLYRFNNRPASDWTSSVTLNAVVAAVVTVAKSAAIMSVASCLSQLKWVRFKTSVRELSDLDLFENASRGPSGAAQLLWHSLKRRPDLLAAVGALLTILAVGFDIIGQQLVKSVPRDVEINQGASFGITYGYNGGVGSDRARGGSFTPLGSTPDIELEGSIFKGIYKIETQDVFTCPSRCIWTETYATLGIAISCVDVTPGATITLEQDQKRYMIKTPGGVTLEAKFSETMYQALINIAALDLLPTSVLDDGSKIPADFARIGVLMVPVTDKTNNKIDPASMTVTECTVGVSAYSYSNISANGNQFVIGETQSIALSPGDYSWDNSGGSVVFNQAGLPSMKMRAPDLGSIAAFFKSERFSGSVYIGEGAPTGSQGVGMVFLKGDIPAAFEAMAKSMTAHMRSSSGKSEAIGFTVDSVQFIEVHWYYLIFLLVVQALSGVFLAMVWRGSQVLRVTLWKGSTVAILCHDLAPTGGMRATIRTEIESPEQLKELAQQVKAKLE